MKFLIKASIAALLAYALGFIIAVPLNPETKFWRAVSEQRDKEIPEARAARPGEPMIFFAGGSSCAFSVDPKIIEEKCGRSAFNLGFPIACGTKFILHQALEKTQPGDVLVVALEPDALTYASNSPAGTLSYGLAALDGSPSATVGGSSFGNHLSLREYLNLSRPGPGYMATWFSKLAVGKGYRYAEKDIRYHGRIETPVSDPTLDLASAKKVDSVHDDGRLLLETFRDAARKKQVRLVYTMPWLLTAEAVADTNRKANTAILGSIAKTIPSIDDGYQGVATERRYFSDSGLHLTAEGSRLRTNALADALRDWLDKNPR